LLEKMKKLKREKNDAGKGFDYSNSNIKPLTVM